VRLELGQRSRSGTGDKPRRQAADDPRRDEHPDAEGDQEQRRADRRAAHRDRQHLPAADMVAQIAERHQRGQRAGDIGSEHHGDAERAEAHLPPIQHVQRDGQGPAHHRGQQHRSREQVAAALG
jgi:hypothetical protein